jgi:hypothetical protein
LGDTNGKTQTLVDAMAGLEPVLERVGASVGRVVGTLADSDGLQTNLVKSADNAGVFAESLGIVAAESANAAAAATEYQTSIPGTDQYSGPLGAAQRFVDTLKVLNIWYNTSKASADASSGSLTSLTSATVSSAIGAGNAQTAFLDLNPVVEETGKTALEAAGSYLSLYEKIAAADRAARDFAGTSGTVTSAIAEGTRGNLPNPQFRADVTPTSVANAISNLVLQSDARSGRAPNIPTSGMGVIFR